MTDGPGGAKLKYDALGRLINIHSTTTPILGFAYDGIDRIAEYQTTSSITARYVHGPGIDNPIVWYDGSAIGSTTRRFLMADERGSVVSITDSAGATINLNAYDEYGIPAPGNVGKFGYTGQLWLPEVGMWYYKARIYSPTLGRFMQTDPIGYSDGMNWYNYVGSDPVNFVDPLGLKSHYQTFSYYECKLSDTHMEGFPPAMICTPKTTGFYYDDGLPDIPETKIAIRTQTPCSIALEQSGKIEYGGNTATAVILGGMQVSWGTWKNLTTGSHGNYKTYGMGLGAGAGLTRDYGIASSLSDFVGYAETGSIEASAGPVGAGYSSTQNVYNKTVSEGFTAGFSKSLPGLGYRKLGIAATVTATDTTVSDCHVHGN